MVMDGLSLDIGQLNAQAELESLMPAECVGSEYKEITFTNHDDGTTNIRKIWQLQWDRLDINTTGANGDKFLYQSSHNIPAQGQMRRSTLKKQVDCFAELKLQGKNPEDFLGAKHWIRENVENAGTRFEKAWWKSVAIYQEGQTYEEAMGGLAVPVNLNPPTSVPTSEPETPQVDQSIYDLIVSTVDGKTVRASLTALRNEEGIPEEMVNAFQSGTLQDELIEQGFLTEVDGKFVKA